MLKIYQNIHCYQTRKTINVSPFPKTAKTGKYFMNIRQNLEILMQIQIFTGAPLIFGHLADYNCTDIEKLSTALYGKNMQEQLLGTWKCTIFTTIRISHRFSHFMSQREKSAGNSNCCNNRAPPSYPYIFFPLILPNFAQNWVKDVL